MNEFPPESPSEWTRLDNEELEVPHWKPQFLVSPVAPEKEPDRVAPVELTSVALLVVTVAVAPPEVPPPDSFHSVSHVTTI